MGGSWVWWEEEEGCGVVVRGRRVKVEGDGRMVAVVVVVSGWERCAEEGRERARRRVGGNGGIFFLVVVVVERGTLEMLMVMMRVI